MPSDEMERLHPLVPKDERIGESGRVFLNGKEGRDDFRKKIR